MISDIAILVDMLISELLTARNNYLEKLDYFKQLTGRHGKLITKWEQSYADRTYRIEQGKLVSPYSHDQTKGTSSTTDFGKST